MNYQSNFEKQNARFRGTIESEKFNQIFNSAEYNINKIAKILNKQSKVINTEYELIYNQAEPISVTINDKEENYITGDVTDNQYIIDNLGIQDNYTNIQLSCKLGAYSLDKHGKEDDKKITEYARLYWYDGNNWHLLDEFQNNDQHHWDHKLVEFEIPKKWINSNNKIKLKLENDYQNSGIGPYDYARVRDLKIKINKFENLINLLKERIIYKKKLDELEDKIKAKL